MTDAVGSRPPDGFTGSSKEVRAKVTDPAALANLYPEAAEYVDKRWPPGRLETRSKNLHSSQALCVSVLLTLCQRPPDHRTQIMVAIAERAGLAMPATAPMEVDAEVREHGKLLGETGGGTPTALDGLATSTEAVLTIESKFTEPEFGACGQIKWDKVKPHDQRYDEDAPERRFRNCTGWHAAGSDQKPATSPLGVACRLTVKDRGRRPRRYWDVAQDLFEPSVLATPRRCPFATDAYQLMRNLAFAHQWAEKQQPALRWYGFLVTLVEGAPKTSVLRQRVAEFKQLLLPDVRDRIGVVTYQEIASVVHEYGEEPLARWVRERLEAVVGS